MDVYFLRHASAGTRKATDPKEDERRPLDEKGVKQSELVGKFLAALDVEPDAFLSSPLTRTIQTAELVAEQLSSSPSVIVDEALRPDATYEAFQDMLRQHMRQGVIIVTGHNPNLSEFLSLLISAGTSKSCVELKKGAVAVVDYNNGHGAVRWCVTPKLVRTVQDSMTIRSRPKTSRK